MPYDLPVEFGPSAVVDVADIRHVLGDLHGPFFEAQAAVHRCAHASEERTADHHLPAGFPVPDDHLLYSVWLRAVARKQRALLRQPGRPHDAAHVDPCRYLFVARRADKGSATTVRHRRNRRYSGMCVPHVRSRRHARLVHGNRCNVLRRTARDGIDHDSSRDLPAGPRRRNRDGGRTTADIHLRRRDRSYKPARNLLWSQAQRQWHPQPGHRDGVHSWVAAGVHALRPHSSEGRARLVPLSHLHSTPSISPRSSYASLTTGQTPSLNRNRLTEGNRQTSSRPSVS